jgi:hypothetical protein
MKKLSVMVALAAVLASAGAFAGNLQFLSLTVPTSITAGAATAVGALERKTVSIESVGSATYQVQISLDTSATPASSSWQNEGVALTASGTLEVTKPAAWIRINCTAFVSGTPTGRIAGINRL